MPPLATTNLANAVDKNVIGRNEFTRRDIRLANKIYGRDVAGLKGKTTNESSKMPNEDGVDNVPPHIIENYSIVSLYIYVMHVDRITFLIGTSKHIGLIQCVYIRCKNREKFLAAILSMIREYRARGMFEVVTIGAIKAFYCIKSELQDVPHQVALTTCDADRHVEVIESMIRFLKKQIIVVRLQMPYKKIPKQFLIEMIQRVVVLVNSLPRKGGIHCVMLSREIVTGLRLRCLEIRICQYVQGLIWGTKSTEQERSIDALYLGMTDNGSGQIVSKLNTKAVVSVNRGEVIPTPTTIIDRVNAMGEAEQQPDGIHFSGIDGKITIHDLDLDKGDNDTDSNASDDDFQLDDEHQKKFDNEAKVQGQGLASDENQDDHFWMLWNSMMKSQYQE